MSDEEETLKTLLYQGLDEPKTVCSTQPRQATSAVLTVSESLMSTNVNMN